jgi:cleavage and polyadenylation specificity factor subunit 1
MYGLNTINAAENDIKAVYQKHELLDLLEDDTEVPEWKEDITTFLPPDDSDKLNQSVEDELPKIEGDSDFHNKLRELVHEYRCVFARTVSATPAEVPPMKIELSDPKKWQTAASRGPPRPQTPAKQAALIKHLHKMLKAGIIIPSQATEYSQVLLVPKPNKEWRFCVDYRLLNELIISMGWPIPNIERLLVRLGQRKARFFAVLDFTSGYHQVLLHPAFRRFAAFITDFGVFEPVRLWMGLKTAPSYFQQQIATVLEGLLYFILELYLDDIIVFGSTESEFLDNLRTVFQRLKEKNITLNPDKAKIGLTELEYVGRVINEHGLKMSSQKIQRVLDFPLPKTGKNLKQFLGLVNYFRSYVRNFGHTAYPLQEMINNYGEVRQRRLRWTPDLIRCFEELRAAVANC